MARVYSVLALPHEAFEKQSMNLLRSLFALLLAATVSSCSTVEKGTAPRPVPAATSTATETPYPMWTRVTGWLLTPFTGASASVGF